MKNYAVKSLLSLLLVFFTYTNLFGVPPVAKGGNFVINPASSTTLNVLRDCSYEGSSAGVTITITTQPTYGTATVIPATKMVIYNFKAGFSGKFYDDWFEYKITVSGEESAVKRVYLHPATKPDNMIDDVCHVDNPGFTWAITNTPKISTIKTRTDRPWYVGDLDGNGTPEIVAIGEDLLASIVVFKDGDVSDGYSFNLKTISGTTSDFYFYPALSYVGLSRFNNGKGAIVLLNADEYMYAFEYDVVNGTPKLSLKYKSTVKWTQPRGITTKNLTESTSCIGFADFDGDGNIEVYTGNKIFALDGLQQLCSLGVNDNQGFSRQSGHSVDNGSGVSVAADMNKDGYPELIVGNQIYKVTNSGSGWSMSLYKSITPPTVNVAGTNISALKDGRVCLADFNGDGNVDVLISYTYSTTLNSASTAYVVLYGWDVFNNKILFTYTLSGGYYSFSYPLIGDLDGDGKLEIAITAQIHNATNNYDSYLLAYKLPTTFGPTALLTKKWSLPIYESATRTGISLFDFNLDGKMELVYRDMTHLRILNVSGSSFVDLLTSPATSPTTWEMPIVADIDNDGAAEIICSSSTILPATSAGIGNMYVFRSGNSFNWAPARKVWNQYAYNPTFVNEDLTLPRYPMNMAAKLTDEHGVTRTPFNNFLQQSAIMNRDGVSLNSAPNLIYSTSSPARLSYDSSTDKMQVSFSVINNGNAAFRGPVNTILYLYTQATSTYTKIGNAYVYGNASTIIGIGETVNISYTINNFSTITLPSTYDRWYLGVNVVDNSPNAPTYFYGAAECKEGDNLTSSISFISKDRIICEGDTEIVELPNNYSYRWYNSMISTTPLATAGSDNKLSVTKDATERELYFVATYKKNDFSKPISQIRDTIFVYRTPDSLVWTGAANNSDWHDWNNWEKPGGISDPYPRANIARSCTNVLLADGIANYPDLGNTITTYDDYTSASCNNITINHGGEVTYPDKLTYSKAFVDVTLNANRWYMFSPPLKDFYAGDLFVKDANPFLDDVMVYTKLFSKANPQSGYLVGDWTGNFNTPDVLFKAGDGFRLWVDDKGDDSILHPPFTFHYPKSEDTHYIWGPEGLGIWGTYPLPSRSEKHRFIFDNLPNGAGNFTVSTEGVSGTGVAAGQLWLVGNPFMSHLDFTKFYNANSGKIKNLYRIMTENGNYEYYNAGANTLSQYVASMQSFIVEMRDDVSSVTSLTFNGNMTTNRTGIKLRSGSVQSALESEKLTISLMDDNLTEVLSQIFVVAEPGASNSYNGNEDVSLLTNSYINPEEEPTVLYTQSPEGSPQVLSVNRLNQSKLKDLDIPLGIRSVKSGQKINLLIQGQWDFASDHMLYLYDSFEDLYYDLRSHTWFFFNNNGFYTKDLNNRFVIRIGEKKETSIVSEQDNEKISIYANGGSIEVKCNNNHLNAIYIYDLQGKSVKVLQSINTDHYSSGQLANGIYVVKAVSGKSALIRKVVVN